MSFLIIESDQNFTNQPPVELKKKDKMYKLDENEINAIKAVLESRKFFRYQGPDTPTVTSLCEESWGEYLNSPYNLLTTSGTNALVVGMAALGIGPGDEVLIPAYTFVATASAVMQVGAIPIIVNIDETLTLDTAEAEKKINSRTKAIIAVHMDGLICAMDELLALANKHNLLLIEDAAQACGGEYKGKKVGTIGVCGAFSFNVDKIISCGEGGLLTFASKKEENIFKRAFVTHDTACQYGMTMKESLSGHAGFFGLSTRLNEINSAILSEQLKKLPQIAKELRSRKEAIKKLLSQKGIPYREGHDSSGDLGTNIHLIGKDPIHVLEMTKKLVAAGFRAMPPHLRPAHACWQWFSEMSKNDYFVKNLNPFFLTKEEYTYSKADYLRTVQLLSETCRIEIELNDEGVRSESFNKRWMEVVKIYG